MGQHYCIVKTNIRYIQGGVFASGIGSYLSVFLRGPLFFASRRAEVPEGKVAGRPSECCAVLDSHAAGMRLRSRCPVKVAERKVENDMTTDKGEKCAHPVCSCTATSRKYCSTQCAAMEKMPDIDCACGHASCKGRTSE